MGLFLDHDDAPKWKSIGCVAALVLIAAPVGCTAYSAFVSTASAPGRVVSRTLQTDNIIQNYEGFFDRNAAYVARLAQVNEQTAYLAAETDPDERIRLRTELSAMRMSCREIATSYNADSEKQNRSLFKSAGLPAVLSVENCDA